MGKPATRQSPDVWMTCEVVGWCAYAGSAWQDAGNFRIYFSGSPARKFGFGKIFLKKKNLSAFGKIFYFGSMCVFQKERERI